MNAPIDRRWALTAVAALGAGAVLASCGRNSDTGESDTATSESSTSTSTSTSGSSSSSAASLADRFESATTCEVTTELTEGPYYLDVDSIRSDIREDREGATLRVGIRVLDSSCQPIRDAIVEIWHCDATGSYSGFDGSSQTDETRYLRGGQVSDRNGIVEFTTVYPGWYRGRTIHIHSKVHIDNREVLTTQLFFDETVTAEVYEQEPYASDAGRDAFNDTDDIFDERLVLTTSKEGDGYLGLISYMLS